MPTVTVPDAANRFSFKLLWTILRVALGLALLLLSIRGVNWPQVGQALAGAHRAWVALGVGAVLLGLFLRLLRWRLMLVYSGMQPGWRDLGGAFLLGQAANILLPVRGGELVRFGWVTLHHQLEAVPSAGTILLEKYLDLIALVILAAWLGPELPAELTRGRLAIMLPLGLLLTVAMLLALVWGPAVWGRLRDGLELRLGEKWHGRLEQVDRWVVSSRWLRSPGRLAVVLLLTSLVWGVSILTNLAMMQALGIPLNLRAAGLVVGLVYIGLVPAFVPGNLGPFYFFAMLGLEPYGVVQPLRFGFALLLHLAVTLPPLLLAGAYLLARDGKNGKRETLQPE